MDTVMTLTDIQRHLKDKIIPLIEMGNDVIIEDAKSHKLKFKICPVKTEDKRAVEWPDFKERDRQIESRGDITGVLEIERNRW